MASAILPAGQVHPPTGGKSIQALLPAGLLVEGEDGSESGSDSDSCHNSNNDSGRDSYSGHYDDSEADELSRVLHKHKDNGNLTKVFKKHPMILAHALKSLDEDENVLYKFLAKHRHVVGKFLDRHQDFEVLAGFLAKYPAMMHQILEDEPSIIENFLQKEPRVLHVYLNAKGDVLRDYLAANPERFHTYMSRNPSLLSEFCDNNPGFVTAWLRSRQATVHDYLPARPAFHIQEEEEHSQEEEYSQEKEHSQEEEDSQEEEHSQEEDTQEEYIEEDDSQEDDTQEEEDYSSDNDDYNASKCTQKRKKTGRPTRRQAKPKTATSTNSTMIGSSAPASTSDRLLVPYPAPLEILAADKLKSRGIREWSLQEEDCGIKHMLAIRDEGRIKGENRFQEAAVRMNKELSTDRTKVSFKNFWNRCGRMRSGFDERRRQQAPLATSLQGKYTLPSNTPSRNTARAKKALRKNTITKAKAVAAPAPNTAGQAEDSNASRDHRAVIELEEDSDAEDEDEDEDGRVTRMPTPDTEDDIIEITTASETNVEVNTSSTRSTTPQPRSRPGTADISPLTPASSYHTPKASSPSAGRKRKSEEGNAIDQDLIAFANGTRKKKKVNYNF